jgi:hypothetical protein
MASLGLAARLKEQLTRLAGVLTSAEKMPKPQEASLTPLGGVCGALAAAMGGFLALDWVDIAAYASLTMADIEPWEAKLLRKMSEAFVSGMNEGTSPFSIPPADRKSAQ